MLSSKGNVIWLTRQQLVHQCLSWRNVNNNQYLQATPLALNSIFQDTPLFSLPFHHPHPSISCRSLSAGLRLLHVRHTWAVASVWKWGSFAFKQSALLVLGKLDERKMERQRWRSWGWRRRWGVSEKAKGVTPPLRERGGSVCREQWLI